MYIKNTSLGNFALLLVLVDFVSCPLGIQKDFPWRSGIVVISTDLIKHEVVSDRDDIIFLETLVLIVVLDITILFNYKTRIEFENLIQILKNWHDLNSPFLFCKGHPAFDMVDGKFHNFRVISKKIIPPG